jgi:release factor glutamine methyltransferase
VGTGSGAAALIVASERRDAHVHGIDVSARAIRAARKNARSTNLSTVRFHVGHLLEQVPTTMRQRVDFVIANLPTDPRSRPTQAGEREPLGAFIGQGPDGLGLLRELADQAWSVLRPGGALVVMTLDWQVDLFAEELRALGYEPVEEQPSSVTRFRFLRATRT